MDISYIILPGSLSLIVQASDIDLVRSSQRLKNWHLLLPYLVFTI